VIVIESCVLSIDSEDDVVRVRTRVREVAQRIGFDAFAVAAISTASSELARNTWVHGGGGAARVEEVQDGARSGLRMEFRDTGPGIEDIERVLRGGFSTRRSLGLGLSGTRRLVDEFEIRSQLGAGTHIVVAKWARFGSRA
jgi:serine/threonine-protein kinase RsbT